MSSHREAPAISSLSAFVGLPTLASVQVPYLGQPYGR